MNCTGISKSSCLNCRKDLIYWKNQCLYSCPNGTFLSSNRTTCESCVAPCSTCYSETMCSSCTLPLYLIKSANKCANSDECLYGTYPDRMSRVCETCDVACLNCTGPSNAECIVCNNGKGYQKHEGKCITFSCSENEYKEFDSKINEFVCISCDSLCMKCEGAGPSNCTACPVMLHSKAVSGVKNRMQCLTCEQLYSGYYSSDDGTCKGNIGYYII